MVAFSGRPPNLAHGSQGSRWARMHEERDAREMGRIRARVALTRWPSARLTQAQIRWCLPVISTNGSPQDTVNFLQRCKGFVDGIQDERLIWSDDWNWFRWVLPQGRPLLKQVKRGQEQVEFYLYAEDPTG